MGGHRPSCGAAQCLGLRLEKGAGGLQGVGGGSADLVCLPCPKPPRSPQPGCHPSRGFRPVPGAVGVGTGEEPWARTPAASAAPRCSPSLPCICVSPRGEGPSRGAGARRLDAAPELFIAANTLHAFKPSPFWGRFLPFLKYVSPPRDPLGTLSPFPSCAAGVCQSPWISPGANSLPRAAQPGSAWLGD